MFDYEKLFKSAKYFAKKKGITDEDAEEFAQEYVTKTLEKQKYIKLEWVYANFRDFARADKRILSSSQGQLSGFRTISTATPLDSSDRDSAKLEDYLGDTRDLLGDSEQRGEIEMMIINIINTCECEKAKAWALKTYTEWLKENVF